MSSVKLWEQIAMRGDDAIEAVSQYLAIDAVVELVALIFFQMVEETVGAVASLINALLWFL